VIHHGEKKYFAVRRGENTRQTRYFTVRFGSGARQSFFLKMMFHFFRSVVEKKNTLPCVVKKTHGKQDLCRVFYFGRTTKFY
jgi:hypothetical protein